MMRTAVATWRVAACLLAILLTLPFAVWGQNDPRARSVEQSGPWNIQHVSSVTHVAVTNVGAASQSGEWNIRHVGSTVHVTAGQSPHLTSFAVGNCGTTVAIAVTPKVDTLGLRRDVILQNAGTGTIFIGGAHVALTAANGLGLHSGAVATGRIILENFQGRVDCITITESQTLNVIEIWR